MIGKAYRERLASYGLRFTDAPFGCSYRYGIYRIARGKIVRRERFETWQERDAYAESLMQGVPPAKRPALKKVLPDRLTVTHHHVKRRRDLSAIRRQNVKDRTQKDSH